MNQKLSIVIPVYNEQDTIHLILSKIKDVELTDEMEKEVIIIDDCSKDNTIDSISNYQLNHSDFPIKLFEHEKNLGKGAAIHTGISEATGDYLIIQDADLEYGKFTLYVIL